MTDKLVIDTNVAINANGGEKAQGNLKCQLVCMELLEDCKKLDIVLDKQGLIMKEYAKHLNYSGEPNVGDMFFKYLHDNQHDYRKSKIHRVDITPTIGVDDSFEEYGVNQLKDPADRKLLATAIVAQAIIVNATDSDWEEQHALLESLNISIKQLCPEHCYRT